MAKSKKPLYTFQVEITKESGEVIDNSQFKEQAQAELFLYNLMKIKSPETYKGFTMNLDMADNAGTIGMVRLVEVREKDEHRTVWSEMYRKA